MRLKIDFPTKTIFPPPRARSVLFRINKGDANRGLRQLDTPDQPQRHLKCREAEPFLSKHETLG